MPGGRPRIYSNKEEQVRERNRRRRDRYRVRAREATGTAGATNAPNVFISDFHGGDAASGPEPPEGSPEIFAALTETVDNLTVVEHIVEEDTVVDERNANAEEDTLLDEGDGRGRLTLSNRQSA